MGHSTAHPFLVLIYLPNELPSCRIAVSAGRAVGGAVQRNRARRRIQAIMQSVVPQLTPGFDLILLARKPIHQAGSQDLKDAVTMLLQRARLLRPDTQ